MKRPVNKRDIQNHQSNTILFFFLIGSLYINPVGLEPTITPSAPFYKERRCHLIYSPLAKVIYYIIHKGLDTSINKVNIPTILTNMRI